jgi:hypothetical protein
MVNIYNIILYIYNKLLWNYIINKNYNIILWLIYIK